MSLDFTLEKYRDLCKAIASSGYAPMTVRAYLEARELPSRLVVMRHDVDTTPKNEPKMALIENDFGIRSTYYFRYKRGVFQPGVMRHIAGMGHEIGYHYETLDKARGDSEKAIELFNHELALFREVVDVKTISMHGNPLTRWDNRDLWRKYNYDFKDSGILGEAYLSFRNILYLSDTGRNWGPAYKVKDLLPSDAGGEGLVSVKSQLDSTDDVIHLLESRRFHQLYLLTHGVRWANSTPGWALSLLLDTATNLVKRVLLQRASAKTNERSQLSQQ
jgi:hypothetical protein